MFASWNWPLIADILSLIFIIPGAFMVFSAAVGTVRFHSTLARIHAITKPQTTGLLLMIIGTIIRLTGSPQFGPHEKGDIGIMILLVIFALMTNPVTAQRLGRVARREGLYGSEDLLAVNERPARYHPRRVNPTEKTHTAEDSR
ncbi:monovalent cation/H(+) antiporter subunit G [Corynebacterium aquatimens]|uniref:monovalent cation/H(+) antiporter subunit G n=1 Tax=Corynebacterium TaxID=1716 RepID=UPI001F3BB411|nr:MULTISPECIES: monovalent cation/H(+) antiporter subunit G [Corynebacterium]QYH19185.1 monovalent cation/H(+) antiporter subunit G [Corynebacterium aquatimens]UIZ91929.1 monovalent cation/H(+) antiporter subunit G [Corynebacterium sp. CNCTC7651]